MVGATSEGGRGRPEEMFGQNDVRSEHCGYQREERSKRGEW